MVIHVTSEVPAPLRVGVVGGGFMASVHIHAARAAGAEVAGIASSSSLSAQRAARSLGVLSAYESIAEMLGDPAVDVVHVCTPNATHAGFAAAALDAGKHVVCEKPLATTPDSAANLVQRAAAAGKIAAVPFVYRFHPMVREARERVQAGDLGAIIAVQGSYLQDWLLNTSDDDWRVNEELGGPSRAFADIGSHLCDLVEFVTGERISDVCAQARTVHPDRLNNKNITTEDLAAVLFRTSGGTLGTLFVSQLAPGRKNRLAVEISGEKQSLFFDQETPETLWLGDKSATRIITRSADELHEDAARLSRLPAGHPQGYQDAFNAFVADTYSAVAGKTPAGLPDFVDGLRATQITSAVLESARQNSWVTVSAPARAAAGQLST